MKKMILFFVLIMNGFWLQAQVGLNISYINIDATNWETFMKENTSNHSNEPFQFDRSLNFGLDYWFRLEKKRIEFFPTISYAQFTEDFIKPTITLPPMISEVSTELQLVMIDLSFNTNIYFLDFDGDCNCPTFSKQDPFFKKGVFVQISPGILYSQGSLIETNPAGRLRTTSDNFSPNIGLGLGVDLGFSDFFTLTPFVRVKRHFNVNWENLENMATNQKPENSVHETTSINQFEAGLRMGIRWKS